MVRCDGASDGLNMLSGLFERLVLNMRENLLALLFGSSAVTQTEVPRYMT
jgi:hypothetical protein